MSYLHAVKRVMGAGIFLLMGCGSVSMQERVETGDIRGACEAAREGGEEGALRLARALDATLDVIWRVETVSEESLGRLAHVPVSFHEYVPMRVSFEVKRGVGGGRRMTLRTPILHVNSERVDISWSDRTRRELPPSMSSLFPPPEIREAMELPPRYSSRRYQPTPRPRMRWRGGGGARPGRELEAAVTGILSALSLGHVPQRGAGRGGGLTPSSERALYRWYTENAAARDRFEAEERGRSEERTRERREAQRFNRERRSAYRAWSADFRRYATLAALRPSCDPVAEESASFYPSPSRMGCHWLVAMPRSAEGEVELTFQSEVDLGSCRYSATHALSGGGAAIAAIATLSELVGDARSVRTMERVTSEITLGEHGSVR